MVEATTSIGAKSTCQENHLPQRAGGLYPPRHAQTGGADIAYGIFGALAEEVQADKRLKLVATVLDCPFWLDFTEQWDT